MSLFVMCAVRACVSYLLLRDLLISRDGFRTKSNPIEFDCVRLDTPGL